MLALAWCARRPLCARRAAPPLSIGTGAAMEDWDSMDDFDDLEVDFRFHMLTKGRWAPSAKGSRWQQRDSPEARAVEKLLTARATLELDDGLSLHVESRLGEGRFGDVILARTADGERFAVKVALRAASELSREAEVLGELRGVAGYPALIRHCEHTLGDGDGDGDGAGALELLVMERLGPSLHAQWEASTRSTRFSEAETVLRVGRGVLRCLRRLHGAGWVHNDLKPANVLLGAAGSANARRLHLVDFGLVSRVEVAEAVADADYAEGDGAGAAAAAAAANAARIGTPLFASLAAHEGRPTRPSDDLESLAYVLALLAAGTLPWQQAPHARAADAKRAMADAASCDALLVDDLAPAVAHALRGVWREVEACRAVAGAPARELDYDACLSALRGDLAMDDDDDDHERTVAWEWEGSRAQVAPSAARATRKSEPA